MDVFNIVRLLRLTVASAINLLFVLNNNNTSLELSCPLQEGMENGIALDLTT